MIIMICTMTSQIVYRFIRSYVTVRILEVVDHHIIYMTLGVVHYRGFLYQIIEKAYNINAVLDINISITEKALVQGD